MTNNKVRHIFVVNPVAGKGVEAGPLEAKIRDACEVSGAEYEIYITCARWDAVDFVRRRITERRADETLRFYACGGDGTLCAVATGILFESLGKERSEELYINNTNTVHDKLSNNLHDSTSNVNNVQVKHHVSTSENVELGCVPIGTGNDFVRNFGQNEFFSDITKQLLGEPITIDSFGVRLDDEREICGVNMFNVGFDCDVVCKAAEFKKTFMPKKLAYVVGVAVTLVKNKGCTIAVTKENGEKFTRQFELCAVANGGYCGGGFFSAPRRRLNDGLLDISLIKKVSRTTFLRLVGPYKKGTHLGTRLGKRVVGYYQDTGIGLEFTEPTNVSIDGEISQVKSAKFRSLPSSLRFVLPVGVTYTD